jgi:long-subunit fatty acid transport protein
MFRVQNIFAYRLAGGDRPWPGARVVLPGILIRSLPAAGRRFRWRAAAGLAVLLLCIPTAARSEPVSDIPAAFVDIGYGARPMGMGGAFVALADDANGVLWNPAGLVRLESSQLTGMYARQMGLIPYGFIGFAQPVSPRSALGGGAISSGDAALREMTALLAVAHRLRPGLSLGLSAKVRMATYGHNPDGAWDPDGSGNRQVTGRAAGFGLDLGVLYDLTGRTSLGLMWRDIFAPVSWEADNESGTAMGGGESVPMALVLGTAHRWSDQVTMSLSLDRSLHNDGNDRLAAGYENRLWNLLILRAGYGQEITADPDRLYTLGLGLEHDLSATWNLAFDFAYLFHDLADTPRVSLTVGF